MIRAAVYTLAVLMAANLLRLWFRALRAPTSDAERAAAVNDLVADLAGRGGARDLAASTREMHTAFTRDVLAAIDEEADG